MKKTYKKPVFIVEDFAVTDAIATGTMSCGLKLDSNGMTADPFINDLISVGVFGAGMECDEPIDDSYLSGYNKLCYHGAVMMS